MMLVVASGSTGSRMGEVILGTIYDCASLQALPVLTICTVDLFMFGWTKRYFSQACLQLERSSDPLSACYHHVGLGCSPLDTAMGLIDVFGRGHTFSC